MKSLVATALVLSTAVAAMAGGPCYTGRCYTPAVTYVKPYVAPAPVVYPPTQVHVVNNLIGVPVPVAYVKPLALQGNTVYGYTSVAQAYGEVDLALIFDKAARLAENSQTLQGQATEGVLQLAQTLRSDKLEQARILAASQAIREVLSESRKTTVTVENPSRLGLAAEPTDADGVIALQCKSCHASAKFVTTPFAQLSREEQRDVIYRMTTSDAGKRMPRAADKVSVGDDVPPEQLDLLYDARKR